VRYHRIETHSTQTRKTRPMLQQDDTYPHYTAPIVRDDAQNQLGFFGDTGNLFNFRHIVKRHEMDALQFGFGNVRGRLARIGKDDFGLAGQILANTFYETDLVATRAVKIDPENGQRLHNDGIGVALDGWNMRIIVQSKSME
jgi:hypothetical protein